MKKVQYLDLFRQKTNILNLDYEQLLSILKVTNIIISTKKSLKKIAIVYIN